jgi:predicted negative regulator of RcsB-dependent stress response
VDGLLSEKEQLEAIRSWWQDNGRYIISGIVLGVALLVGWNYWNRHQAGMQAEASALYESLVTDVADNEIEAAEATADELFGNYGDTVYAAQGRLAMAKLYMSAGRDQDAADELAALLAGNDGGELQMVARLRLARILLYQEKPQEVVDLLSGYGDSAFAARYMETLGDAYVALERFGDAREAYVTALADDPEAPTVDQALIRMKINDLPAASAAEAQPPPATGSPEDAAAETPANEAATGDAG